MKDKIQGKAEELKGRATGDRAAELKGKARQAVGEAKRLARDLGVEPRASREQAPEGRGDVDRAPETGAAEPAPPGPTRPTDP